MARQGVHIGKRRKNILDQSANNVEQSTNIDEQAGNIAGQGSNIGKLTNYIGRQSAHVAQQHRCIPRLSSPMKTILTLIYLSFCVWNLIRLFRSAAPAKVRLVWTIVILLLPLGAFLFLICSDSKQRLIRRYVLAIYSVILTAFLGLYGMGFRWYAVPSLSMEPAIKHGEHVIGRLDATYAKKMKRFDIVIYRRPDELGSVFMSRLIGLPGDHIVIRDDVLSVNGEKIRMLARRGGKFPGPKECDVHLANDAFFVIGDHDEVSLDSRIFGPIPTTNLSGHLVFRR
jgi:signal peptidase I